jgi:methionine-rich copper-binding protein CopC
MTRRHARIGCAVAVAASALVALAASAAAHSALLRSEPTDGARLEHAPGEVVLTFSEHTERRPLPGGGIRLIRAAG